MSENELLKPDAIESDDDDTVCLGESFFIDNNYELATFTFGSHVLHLLCLQSASTDFDLTGQLVWPGARLLNQYISNNVELLQGSSALELGSGVGVTGILCSRFCHKVVLTDHNDEVLKILNKNIELHESSEDSNSCAALSAEKLEWGNSDQLDHILQKHPEGFDLILGADICFQQNSVPPLFDTVKQLLCLQGKERCRFILAYVSRSKMMDVMVTKEAIVHGLQINEVEGSRSVISNLEGVIYEITL
ncbi:putative calmodulin-lysine N-methyltransferase [Helianthus annuus]|nr:putative calmodulin-lysine N-methyltransferase [Helianthus annuus]